MLFPYTIHTIEPITLKSLFLCVYLFTGIPREVEMTEPRFYTVSILNGYPGPDLTRGIRFLRKKPYSRGEGACRFYSYEECFDFIIMVTVSDSNILF